MRANPSTAMTSRNLQGTGILPFDDFRAVCYDLGKFVDQAVFDALCANPAAAAMAAVLDAGHVGGDISGVSFPHFMFWLEESKTVYNHANHQAIEFFKFYILMESCSFTAMRRCAIAAPAPVYE